MGADRCLGDVVTEMLSTIEDSDDPHEEAHVYLVTLFPQFAHIFSELKEVCVCATCAFCILHTMCCAVWGEQAGCLSCLRFVGSFD